MTFRVDTKEAFEAKLQALSSITTGTIIKDDLTTAKKGGITWKVLSVFFSIFFIDINKHYRPKKGVIANIHKFCEENRHHINSTEDIAFVDRAIDSISSKFLDKKKELKFHTQFNAIKSAYSDPEARLEHINSLRDLERRRPAALSRQNSDLPARPTVPHPTKNTASALPTRVGTPPALPAREPSSTNIAPVKPATPPSLFNKEEYKYDAPPPPPAYDSEYESEDDAKKVQPANPSPAPITGTILGTPSSNGAAPAVSKNQKKKQKKKANGAAAVKSPPQTKKKKGKGNAAKPSGVKSPVRGGKPQGKKK